MGTTTILGVGASVENNIISLGSAPPSTLSKLNVAAQGAAAVNGLAAAVNPLNDVSSDRQDPRKRADDTTSDEDARQAREPTYMAHVALAATGIRTENGFTRFEPGMAVTAEIKTGRRTVISYLLSPLSRFKQEGPRER